MAKIVWTRILALAAPYEANTFQRFNAADTPARFLKFESPQASSWGQPREIRVYGVTR